MLRSPFPDPVIPDRTLADYVLEAVVRHGDRPAIIDGSSGRGLSYADIARDARRCAAGLVRRGFLTGEVFAIWLPNLPEYAIAFLGVNLAGGVVTTVNPLSTAEECAYQLRETAARHLLTLPQFADRAREAVAAAGDLPIYVLGEADGAIPFSTLLEHDGPVPQPAIDPARALAALPCSSGTTGRPKAVMLTHRNLVAQLCQAESLWERNDSDVSIAVLPFFHIYGMMLILLLGLRLGTRLISLPRFDLETFLRCIEQYKVTQASLVPPIVLALAKHPMVERFDLSSLRRISSGAAPLGGATEDACFHRLHCKVAQGFGMTELAGAAISHPADQALIRSGSVGMLWPGMSARIVDTVTGAEAAAGGPGELLIRGPSVMQGYLNRPEATAETLDADGWLHTGDVARVDADGYFYIVDRVKELIKYNAWQVAPAELEAILASHPAVADAAVIPSPDEESGEVPKALVVLKGSITPDELMAWVAERVAPYKKIRLMEVVESIPRSAAGKILRRTLVERERTRAGSGT